MNLIRLNIDHAVDPNEVTAVIQPGTVTRVIMRDGREFVITGKTVSEVMDLLDTPS